MGWEVQQLGVVPLEVALVGVEEDCPTSEADFFLDLLL